MIWHYFGHFGTFKSYANLTTGMDTPGKVLSPVLGKVSCKVRISGPTKAG